MEGVAATEARPMAELIAIGAHTQHFGDSHERPTELHRNPHGISAGSMGRV